MLWKATSSCEVEIAGDPGTAPSSGSSFACFWFGVLILPDELFFEHRGCSKRGPLSCQEGVELNFKWVLNDLSSSSTGGSEFKGVSEQLRDSRSHSLRQVCKPLAASHAVSSVLDLLRGQNCCGARKQRTATLDGLAGVQYS